MKWRRFTSIGTTSRLAAFISYRNLGRASNGTCQVKICLFFFFLHVPLELVCSGDFGPLFDDLLL